MEIRLRLYVAALSHVQVFHTMVFKRFLEGPEIIC
jgi:hypothetical protein